MDLHESREEVLLTAQGMKRAGATVGEVARRLEAGGFSPAEAELLIAEMDEPTQAVQMTQQEWDEELQELQLTAQGMLRAGADRAAVVARLMSGGYDTESAEAFVDWADRVDSAPAAPSAEDYQHEHELDSQRTTARDERIYLNAVQQNRYDKGRRQRSIGLVLIAIAIVVGVLTSGIPVIGLGGLALLLRGRRTIKRSGLK